jgi:hypothetical protein
MKRLLLVASLSFSAFAVLAAPPVEAAPMSDTIPRAAGCYAADGGPQRYDRQTAYDYMDGGAEVYLAYGMQALWVQTYACEGEPPITLNLFEMDSPSGAFGVFTYEREDDGAGIGQGSEYGGGILRFWQGRDFVFLQAETETTKARDAVLAIGNALASQLGPAQPAPALPAGLPADGLRPLSVRFVTSPLLLEAIERAASGNPLGLPRRCEAVVGRYGTKGGGERVVLAEFPDEKSAQAGVAAFLKARAPGTAKPGEPYSAEGGWCAAATSGLRAVLVLGAPDAAAARRRLVQAVGTNREVGR